MLVASYPAFVILCIGFGILKYFSWKSLGSNVKSATGNNPNFLAFQKQYFPAYFLAVIADWLQGPYLYNLYHHYGYVREQIGILYVCGFASAVVFGTWAPFVANNYGRKKLCICFTIIYSLSCFMKLSDSYGVLILGRVLGGIATSLVFPTYNAWYIHEHLHTHDFPSEWIPITMSKVSAWNGVLAVCSGVVANAFAEWFRLGPVAPFMVAIPCLLTSGIIVMATWSENYGEQKIYFKKACIDGIREIADDRAVLLVGCVQALFESVLYIFVFMWTPLLLHTNPHYGLVFSCFMVCITIGTAIHELLTSKVRQVYMLAVSISIAFLCMCVCSWFSHPEYFNENFCFLAFLLYEMSVGVYFATMAKLRTKVLPEKQTMSIMSWFRVPLNIIACIVLLSLHNPDRFGDSSIFMICAILLCCSIACTTKLTIILRKREDSLESVDQSLLLPST